MVFDENSNQVIEGVSIQELKEEYSRLYLKNKETLDGLYYAASIQQGLLPQERHFKRSLNDFFVLYRPQQIIGGDLYWVSKKNETVYFATADCTGHGVSGALLSVLAISFLNYILHGKDHRHLGEMINELDKKWIETFDFSLEYVFDNDWMELSLLSFNYQTRELKFSGANSNAYIVSDNSLKELKGSPFPVGGWQLERNRVFEEQALIIPENTMIYIGSDGFKDQFGGTLNKRFTKRRLQGLLTEISGLPTLTQKTLLENAFDNWKGTSAQIDDVCLMGVKL